MVKYTAFMSLTDTIKFGFHIIKFRIGTDQTRKVSVSASNHDLDRWHDLMEFTILYFPGLLLSLNHIVPPIVTSLNWEEDLYGSFCNCRSEVSF